MNELCIIFTNENPNSRSAKTFWYSYPLYLETIACILTYNLVYGTTKLQ